MQHRPSLEHVHSQTLKYFSMDIVQSCWQQETPKPQGSLKPWRGNAHQQTHPVASSCEGTSRGRIYLPGEAARVAKQQLQLQGTLGSPPIISTQVKPSTELLLLPFTCCQQQQGASRTSSPGPKQGLSCPKSNITTGRT